MFFFNELTFVMGQGMRLNMAYTLKSLKSSIKTFWSQTEAAKCLPAESVWQDLTPQCLANIAVAFALQAEESVQGGCCEA